MAKLKIEIPAPCNYEAQLAKEKDCVVINAYDNKEKEQGEQGEPGEK